MSGRRKLHRRSADEIDGSYVAASIPDSVPADSIDVAMKSRRVTNDIAAERTTAKQNVFPVFRDDRILDACVGDSGSIIGDRAADDRRCTGEHQSLIIAGNGAVDDCGYGAEGIHRNRTMVVDCRGIQAKSSITVVPGGAADIFRDR